MLVKEKVLVYATWQDCLLTFTQPKFPEAGRQVVGGTLTVGEQVEKAALRELAEESGIYVGQVEALLGYYTYSMSSFGKNEIQSRHVVHVKIPDAYQTPLAWTHFEKHAESGESSIEFRLEWVPLFAGPIDLIAGHDFFLPMLKHALRPMERQL